MKKSKFLKKSLAMLLALMLVVAMIPLSAAAAETPSVTKVTVAGAVVEDGQASIADPGSGKPTVVVELLNGNGLVKYGDETVTVDKGVFTFSMTEEDVAAKSFSFDVYTNDNVFVETVEVALTYTDKSGNNSVASVSYPNMYGQATSSGTTFTVLVPYDDDRDGILTIKLEDAKAEVESSATGSNGVYTIKAGGTGTETFTVKSENGVSVKYTVKLVYASAFESFSVEGERKAATIGRVTAGAADKTVTIHMPYGTAPTNGSFEFVPTFTTNYDSITVTAKDANNDDVAFTSGKTYDLADFVSPLNEVDDQSIELTVHYSETVAEEWTLTFEVPDKDPVAAITGVTVQNYQATIDGTVITLTIPESLRKANQTVVIKTNNDITVTGVDEITNSGSSASVNATLDLSKDEYTLRATAKIADAPATTPEVKDYTLVIETAEVQPASMTNMTLRDTNGVDYEAVIDQTAGTITFNDIPYSVKTKANLANWKLFWTASSGSTVTYQTTQIVKLSGSAVVGDEGFLPNANKSSGKRFVNAKAEHAIVVEAPGYSAKQYTVVFNSADPSTASTLSDVKLTTANKYNEMTDGNSLDVDIDGTTLTVDVPFKDWNAGGYTGGAWVATTLPAGAKIYFPNKSDQLDEIDVLNANSPSTGLGTNSGDDKLPSVTDYGYGQEWTASSVKSPLKVLVASEALVEEITEKSTTLDDIQKDNSYLGKYTLYTLSLIEAAPRETAELTGFSVYNAYDKTTATGTVKGNQIEITLPYYYDKNNAAKKAELYLDFDVKGGESVVAEIASTDLTATVYELSFNRDGSVNETASTAVVAHPSACLQVNTNKSFDRLVVTSEDGDSENTYYLTVKYADAENGAELNSVTINGYTGTPDANHKVVINVPYATEVTSLVPTFNVSKNAYVKYGTSVVDPGYAFNFTADKTIQVVSESGVNTNTYTVSVVVDDQFSDVTPDDWFYENVMNATAHGYMSGMGDGTFKPYGATTRAQFACIIANAMGYTPAEGEVETRFTDVPADQWYAGAVAFCYENGYISGYDDGTFQPNKTISRQEAAAILNNAFNLAEEYGVSDEPFTDDASIAGWAKDHVYAAKAAGLMKGDAGTGNFRPASTIIRAEAASIMMNANNAGLID